MDRATSTSSFSPPPGQLPRVSSPPLPPSNLNSDGASPHLKPSEDSIIRQTDTDASISRLSASSLGYLSDPFAPFFVSRTDLRGQPSRRPPIINIGTHVRTWSIDTLVREFLDGGGGKGKGKGKQIVSLGAGTDTRFFRLAKESEEKGGRGELEKYVEIDFAEATSKKCRIVRQKGDLNKYLGDLKDVKIG